MGCRAMKEIAEKAIKYITFHTIRYGIGSSFDVDRYFEEVIQPALSKQYLLGNLTGRLQTYDANKRYCENEVKQMGYKLERLKNE